MLQYDLTDTKLFDTQPTNAPSDAEMFVVTAALLLVYEAPYSDLQRGEVALTPDNIDAVANCIEQRLPEFACDLEVITPLRERIQDFVGLRIRYVAPTGAPARPT